MEVRNPKNKARLNNIYKILVLIFVVTLLLLPKSVTSMPDIETKLLLTVIGIDKTEDGYRVSATAIMPDESESGSTKRMNVDADGDSISKALETIGLKMGKKLELGLCGLIVVGDTFGDESLLPHFEYFLSSGKIVPGAYLILSPGKSAKETIELSNKLSEASSNGLSKLIEHNAIGTNMPAVTLLKFLCDTGSVSKSSYLPCIEIAEKQSEQSGGGGGSGDSGGQQQQSSGGSGGQENETEIKSLAQIAFFNEGRFVKMLSESETRGFTWSDESSTQGLVTLDDFTVKDKNVGKLFCQLVNKKFSVKAAIGEENNPRACISVTAIITFEDRYKLSDLFKYDGISEEELHSAVEEQMRDKIKSEMQSAVDVMKEVNCDAMGITEEMHKFDLKHYKAYSDKDNLFSDTEIYYDIKVKFS